jgi:hypothetical protein
MHFTALAGVFAPAKPSPGLGLARCTPVGRLALLLASLAAAPAHATFHFMHTEQVVGGVNGDASAQAIQLRMRVAQQHMVDRGKLVAWDATGANPIVLIDFAEEVSEDAAGSRILVVSRGFTPYTDPPVEPDFVLTNLIPPSYLAAGSITFESDEDDFVVCRLSWGGAAYTGDTTGALTNDDDGEFGPPVPGPLPHSGVEAVRYMGYFAGLSTTNADDYALTGGAAVFTNNAGNEFTVRVPQCPMTPEQDPVDEDGDGVGSFCDECPDDADKAAPGECGCGVPDIDVGNDGDIDCPDDPDNPGGDSDDPPPPDGGDDGDPDGGADGGDPDNPNDDGGPDGSDGDAPTGPRACGVGMIPVLLFGSSVLIGTRLRRLSR